MAKPTWQTFNRAAAGWVQQLGLVQGDGLQARVLRLHDVAPASGRTSGLHAHAWFELSVVDGGEVAYIHEGEERRVGPGGTFAMPPGRRHGWRVAGGTPVITGYQLAISATDAGGRPALERWFDRLAAGGWTLPAQPVPAALAGALHDGIGAGTVLACQLIRAHLLWSLAAFGAGAAPVAEGADEADPFPALREYLLEHLAEELPLADLARRLRVSPRHLNRRFVQLAGQPLHRFIIEQRLERAAHSLIWSDAPVVEVARSVGYDDAGYFGRLFRARFGASPERWRQESRRNQG